MRLGATGVRARTRSLELEARISELLARSPELRACSRRSHSQGDGATGPQAPKWWVAHLLHHRLVSEICPSERVQPASVRGGGSASNCWAEAPKKIARMTLTIKLDGNWSSFQLANSAPPLSVTGSAIAPSARILSELPATLMHHSNVSK